MTSKQENQLLCISPIDGRYRNKTENLKNYFSEFALQYYRLYVEITYLQQLLTVLNIYNHSEFEKILEFLHEFSIEDAMEIKQIEKTTNHDIKAIEYFIQNKLKALNLTKWIPYVHFGLTSQDINNTAIPLSLRSYFNSDYLKNSYEIMNKLGEMVDKWKHISFITRTHGQPASPSTIGKELNVFLYRLNKQYSILTSTKIWGKFGGATGNFNAHVCAYPHIDWENFGNTYLTSIGLYRNKYTTQIDNYENLSVLFDAMVRVNVILIDMCRDIWSYISMDYFKCKVEKNEVGSSTMPHKVNPIQFENAEGNLLLANTLFTFMSQKLPISRLQRDLTDSTVLRNLGTAFGHIEIAYSNIITGLNKLDINMDKINEDIEKNWVVISEAIQTILRKHNFPDPYEKMKSLTRENNKIGKEQLYDFVNSLDVSSETKAEILQITPYNYVGYACNVTTHCILKNKTVQSEPIPNIIRISSI